MKSKGRTVEAAKFTFALERSKQAAGTPEQIPAAMVVTQSTGELTWVEPFVTGKSQVLHFEIQSRTLPSAARNYLLVCTLPKARGETEAIWKELRSLRRTFEIKPLAP